MIMITCLGKLVNKLETWSQKYISNIKKIIMIFTSNLTETAILAFPIFLHSRKLETAGEK